MALAITLKLLCSVLLANIYCIEAQKGYGSVWQMNNPSTVPGHASSAADRLSHFRPSNLQPDSGTYGSSLKDNVLSQSYPATAKPMPNSFWASYLLGSSGNRPGTVKFYTGHYDSSGSGSAQASSVFPQHVGSQIWYSGDQNAVQQPTFVQSSSGSAQDTGVWSSAVQKPVSGLTQTGYGLKSQVVTDSTGYYGTDLALNTQADYGSVPPTGTQTKFGHSQSMGQQAGSTSFQKQYLPLQERSNCVPDEGFQSGYSSVQNVLSASAPRLKYNPFDSSTDYYGSSLGLGSHGSRLTSEASGSHRISNQISAYSDGQRSGQVSYGSLKGRFRPGLAEISCDSEPRAQIGSSVTLGRSESAQSRFGLSAPFSSASSMDTMPPATFPAGYGMGSRVSCSPNRLTGIKSASGTDLGSRVGVGFQNRYGWTCAGQRSDKRLPSYGFWGGLGVARVTGSQSSFNSLLNPLAFSPSTGSGSLKDVDNQSGYSFVQEVASNQAQDGYGFPPQVPPKLAMSSGFSAPVLGSGYKGHRSTQGAGSHDGYSSVQASGSVSKDCGLTPDMGSQLNLGSSQVNYNSGSNDETSYGSQDIHGSAQAGHSSGKYSLAHHTASSGMGSQLAYGFGPYESTIGFGSPSCGSSQVPGLNSVLGPTQGVSYPSSASSILSSSETSYTSAQGSSGSAQYAGIYDSVSAGIPTSTQAVGSQSSSHRSPYRFGQEMSSSAQGAGDYSTAKTRSQQRSGSAQVNPGYPGCCSSPMVPASASQSSWLVKKFLPHVLSGN